LVPDTVTAAPIAPVAAETVGAPAETTVTPGRPDPPVVVTVTAPGIAAHGTVVAIVVLVTCPRWVAPPNMTDVTADTPPLKKSFQ
jgi:hypothetical protein